MLNWTELMLKRTRSNLDMNSRCENKRICVLELKINTCWNVNVLRILSFPHLILLVDNACINSSILQPISRAQLIIAALSHWKIYSVREIHQTYFQVISVTSPTFHILRFKFNDNIQNLLNIGSLLMVGILNLNHWIQIQWLSFWYPAWVLHTHGRGKVKTLLYVKTKTGRTKRQFFILFFNHLTHWRRRRHQHALSNSNFKLFFVFMRKNFLTLMNFC